MSIVVRFKPTSLTTEQYDETIRRLKDAGDFPPDGCAVHVVFGTEGTCRSARSGTRRSNCRRSETG